MTNGQSAHPRIPSVRISPDNATVVQELGLLGDLAGRWHGAGFNLVARPDFEDHANLFLELNLTQETLTFTPISSSIPNRGFAQPDIALFGLTYLQQISDATTGGALHIEPGIWVTQPATSTPPLSPPAGGALVARMGNIPHGNSLLAQGIATTFSGPPTISPGRSRSAAAIPPSPVSRRSTAPRSHSRPPQPLPAQCLSLRLEIRNCCPSPAVASRNTPWRTPPRRPIPGHRWATSAGVATGHHSAARQRSDHIAAADRPAADRRRL